MDVFFEGHMDVFKNNNKKNKQKKNKQTKKQWSVLSCIEVFFCLSAVTLKKDPLPDQKQKHPLALVCSVNTDLFLKDTSILQNKNRISSGVYFHVVASRGRGRSPVMLRAHGWRSKVIGHLLIQTTLHPFLQSCSLLHKQ